MENNRRAYGSGCILPVTDNSGNIVKNKWLVRYSYVEQSTGARKRPTKTVTGPKREAQAVLNEMRAAYSDGLDTDAGQALFRDFAASWQAEREASGTVRDEQARASAAKIEIINRYIGGTMICDITPYMVQNTLSNIRESRKGRDGRPLANSTLAKYYSVLEMIMQSAFDLDYIRKNPCKQVKQPKASRPERRALSKSDAARLSRKLAECAANYREAYNAKEQRQEQWGADSRREYTKGITPQARILAARIALATGARRGEVLALTWGDLVEDGECLHIRRSLSTACKLQAPKTVESDRFIYLDADTVQTLSEWRGFVTGVFRRLGAIPKDGKPSDATPICCTDSGGFIAPRNFQRWWEEWREENGFHTLKFHELRHTHATLLLANGVDVKTVQARLGHANPEITLKWYAHAIPDNDRRAANALGSILGGERATACGAAKLSNAGKRSKEGQNSA